MRDITTVADIETALRWTVLPETHRELRLRLAGIRQQAQRAALLRRCPEPSPDPDPIEQAIRAAMAASYKPWWKRLLRLA